MTITLCGAVSATDDLDDVKYVSITGSDDNDGTETNPYLTIGKGITSVNPDGTVNVDDGTYYEHLTISKNVNLVGKSQENTILDGSNTGRPITIDTGATVNISLFTIQNGNAYGSAGGGINNAGNLTMSNSTISGNTGNDRGGGIVNYGTLTVSNSTINGNTVQYYGGGIYNYGTLILSGSTISGNTVNSDGGGIMNIGTLKVSNSTISGNTARYGGGIYNDDIMEVFDSTISGNTAYWGGGIFNVDHLIIENCELISNSAFNTQGYAYGGAIYNILGTLSINNSKIQKNSATGAWNSGSAGAIYNYEGFLTIKNSLVEENTAQYGGALFFIHQTINVVGEVLIENCSISKNIATGSGGAMVTYLTTTIIDSVISDNIAQGTYSLGGAIIQYNHGSLTIIRTLIENNQANREGGAIYSETYEDGFLTIQDSKITGNSAEKGGAIYSDNYGLTSIINCIIEGNTASLDGGFLYKSGTRGSALLKFNRIITNTAVNGAALYNPQNTAFNAEYNWWGSNNPDFTTLIVGNVDYNPWLYMTLQANPNTIGQGETSKLTASFNNAYDGTTVTSLNPDNGHIPDKTPVTFNTDLGSVGSKTINKETTDGVAIATLTADETLGIAQVNAVTDAQTVKNDVTIKPKSSLYLTITPSKNNPMVGETVIYTLKVGNKGPNTAENVVMTYTIPQGLEFAGVKVDVGTYTYDAATRTITWTIGDVPVGDPYMWLSLKVTSAGRYLINPLLSTSTYDPTINTNTQSLTVNAAATPNNNNNNTNTNNTVNAATNTVNMRETGIPLIVLIMALFMVIGGLVSSKK